MSGRANLPRHILGCALLGGAFAACGEASTPLSPEAIALEHARHAAVAPASTAEYNKQLAALRRATARFHRFEAAREAGWFLQFTPCIVSPAGAGGMGFHYVNPDLMDFTQDVAAPEALLFEPDANGRLRLVAVEYLIPFSLHGPDESPPTLYGLPYAPSPAFEVWGLHAWVWKHNSSGMHAPFNPDVSCDDA
jgi:hypothetical protein